MRNPLPGKERVGVVEGHGRLTRKARAKEVITDQTATVRLYKATIIEMEENNKKEKNIRFKAEINSFVLGLLIVCCCIVITKCIDSKKACDCPDLKVEATE